MLGAFSLAPPPSLDIVSPHHAKPPQLAPRRTGQTLPPAPTWPDSATASPVARAAVAQEFANLRYEGHCPLGMYIVPAADNLFVWDGVLFVHQGYYTDSILKFRVIFPPNYPDRAPNVQFITDVFHPLIAQQDGEFNVASRFRPWRPKEHHVYDVLHWLKASFKKHALDDIKEIDCLNKEAFRLYHDSTSSFAALATQSSMLSQLASSLFDQDHPSMANKGPVHGIPFKELRTEESSALRQRLGLTDWDE
ncbi:unnamed protein product [Peniophora sp. CBMAI 1063]|nr:unnamed protein product [Peniophora sp. CBMAI 1063]